MKGLVKIAVTDITECLNISIVYLPAFVNHRHDSPSPPPLAGSECLTGWFWFPRDVASFYGHHVFDLGRVRQWVRQGSERLDHVAATAHSNTLLEALG